MVSTNALDGISDVRLKNEIISLVQYIHRFREEVAQMVARENDQTKFDSMAEQLDAIVSATEKATHSILESVESIDEIVEKIRSASGDEERNSLCDEIGDKTMAAMEACTFQDITGQRVNKIVRSMQFVEERVETMTQLWGKDEISAMADGIATDEREGDAALLNGPALETESSISQDDIDKLFD
ncbi:protein phosphatase CheZ [Aestuariispira insulae]|uniref:Chemotaxis protein CheZ n=1 Tax=Aestuariispira insulae TaxID=1461337 RepID=A0A3D9HN80_9PROT|nr:protein phosphatase CheZ [Aestuariispira insulae]RED50929.1 chemotaxis protein CheZ [Aestuariispira insulae]